MMVMMMMMKMMMMMMMMKMMMMVMVMVMVMMMICEDADDEDEKQQKLLKSRSWEGVSTCSLCVGSAAPTGHCAYSTSRNASKHALSCVVGGGADAHRRSPFVGVKPRVEILALPILETLTF